MKIERVEITNFRGIDHLTLDFVDPAGKPLDLVVLAGPNGCGKTSVLEACLIALDYASLHGEKGKTEFNRRAGKQDFTVDLRFLARDGQRHECSIMGPVQSAKDSANGAIKSARVEYFSSWREPKLVGALSVSAGKPGKRPRPVEENRLWLVKQYLIDLTAHRAFQKSFLSIDHEPAFSKINTAWKFFYPRNRQRFVVEPVSESIEAGFDLFLVEKDGQWKIPVDKLSSGEIEVLTMLGWFAIRDFDSGVLFIDEPELHLHPAWHRAILRALREVLPDTQIICATHSADVLDAVEYYQRFILLDENDPRIRLRNSRAHGNGLDG